MTDPSVCDNSRYEAKLPWRDAVPLSEDEQRILSEIEQRLYESDPRLAREVRSTTVYSASARSLKWAAFAFLAGFIAMIATLKVSFLVAFGCFLVMLISALAFEQSLRRLGRVGFQQLTQRSPSGGMRAYLGNTGQRVRDRLRNDDQPPAP